MSRRRVSQQQRDREFQRREAEQRAERQKRERVAEMGRFIMEAGEHTLALIERFGVTALRAQQAANAVAYREEARGMEREHVRRTMADALALAAKHPPPASFRIALYSADRRVLGELAKLGIRTGNEAGDG